jgi:hypothetical protein
MPNIDYGNGQTNIDPETGIRFGVISQNEVLQAWADSSEADYGDPTCGECGNAAIPSDSEWLDDVKDADWYEGKDYACLQCERCFWSDDAFGERENGAKAYCFGHDWFENGVAPYPVYRVVDDAAVEPELDVNRVGAPTLLSAVEVRRWLLQLGIKNRLPRAGRVLIVNVPAPMKASWRVRRASPTVFGREAVAMYLVETLL